MKHCHDCDQDKPLSAFYEHDGKPYGPCKVCRTAKARARYAELTRELGHLRTIVAAVQAQVPYLGGELG